MGLPHQLCYSLLVSKAHEPKPHDSLDDCAEVVAMQLPQRVGLITQTFFDQKFVQNQEIAFDMAVMVQPRISGLVDCHCWSELVRIDP